METFNIPEEVDRINSQSSIHLLYSKVTYTSIFWVRTELTVEVPYMFYIPEEDRIKQKKFFSEKT